MVFTTFNIKNPLRPEDYIEYEELGIGLVGTQIGMFNFKSVEMKKRPIKFNEKQWIKDCKKIPFLDNVKFDNGQFIFNFAGQITINKTQ